MRTFVAALLVILSWSHGAAAQEFENGDGWGVAIAHENDLFEDGHDYNYTSGELIEVTTFEGSLDGFLEDVSDLTPFEDDFGDVRLSFGLSHAMFTPRDLTLDMPDPDDRPYAGMLLLSLGLVGSNHNPEKREQADRFDSLVYSIGVVGPSSRADDIQRWLHNYQEGIEPRGWRAQIDDRVVAGLAYQQTRRVFTSDAFDVFGHAGFSLGSIQTQASLGGSIRVGYQRPVDFGLSRLAPSLPGSGYFRTNHPWGVYAFVGGEQRYVAYDVTLDESPRRGPNNIRRRDWVGDVQVGAAFYVGWFRASYTHIWRSEQFHTQREGDGFGAIAIGLTLGGGPR